MERTYCGAENDEKKMASEKTMKRSASQSMSMSGRVGSPQKLVYCRGVSAFHNLAMLLLTFSK